MRNKAPLSERARGRWSGILQAMGIAESYLTGKHGPCPLCGGKDRWRWDNREGRGTWICSQCRAGDGISLVMKKNGWDFRQAAKRIEAVLESSPIDASKRSQSDQSKRSTVNRLWVSSKPVHIDDPVGLYLARRVGLTAFPTCLRTAYNLRHKSDPTSLFAAMIAMMTAPDGTPSTVQKTYVTELGFKAPVTEPRLWMPGTIAKGAAIRLAPAGQVLGIAEGIETALSASVLFRVPCWAAGNANMLSSWEPPAEVNRILIFGDNDLNYAGQAAAYALAKRLETNGRLIKVEIPTETGTDWNDIHRLSSGAAKN